MLWVSDPEVLLQIPRLKKTLLVLDSEMHTTESSDIDKRLVMHERILQMQGVKVNKMRQAVERTAQSVGQMMDTTRTHCTGSCTRLSGARWCGRKRRRASCTRRASSTRTYTT